MEAQGQANAQDSAKRELKVVNPELNQQIMDMSLPQVTFVDETRFKVSDIEVQIVLGNICDETTTAVTNAANEYLAHGGGLARAISNAGGPVIDEQSE